MAQAQMIEGTTEEVTRRLLENFPSQKLRVFVETEETDLGVNLHEPPNTVRDKAHLIELLREGLNSPTQEFTEESWERKREEVHRRHTARQP